MVNVKLLITYKKDLEYVNDFHGLLIYCKDTKEAYYVNEHLNKIDISLNVVFLHSKSDLDSIISPILSRVYLIEETNEIFKYTNRWVEITTEDKLIDIIETSIDYLPGVLYKDHQPLAPKTTASSVYMEDGSRLDSVLDSNLLTVTKTKAVYVEAEINDQRIFNIPYPISGYNLCKNHISVIIRGRVLETSNYVINNNKLILSTNYQPLNSGELVLFIFYYTVVLDLNENVVLTTKNYEDRSITTEKLADDIAIKATNILETPRRFFLTANEREKLNSIDYGATNYHHPPNHPASIIIEDDERQFISKKKKEEIDMKAFSRDVYTKEETAELLSQLFERIVGSSPETLDTLRELADALGNDPNFATTILNKLTEKADSTEIVRIDKELEKKVGINDHLRNGIYGTPIKTAIYDVDHYRMSISDPKFKEYIDGMPVSIKINETNQGACMLQINGLDPKPILTQDQYPLLKGELIVGSIYTLRYNGTTGNFILQGKGGVNLINTARSQYVVDENESVIRGDLLDLMDNKVRVSVPRCKLLSKNICDSTKFACDGNLQVISLTKDKFIVIWKDGKLLKAYLFNTVELDMFITGNLAAQEPIIVNLESLDFNAIKIHDSKIIIFYSQDLYNLHAVVLNVVENQLIPGSVLSFQESYHIFNLKAIWLKENRFFLGYQFEDKTKLMYCQVIDNDITILSERTNVDYRLDTYCFVNEEQILFAGLLGNRVRGWIMNINNLDFNYTTLSTLVPGESDDDVFNNLSFTLIGERKLYFTYTNKDNTIQYGKYLDVDFNGDIIMYPSEEIRTTVEEVKNNLISNRLRVHGDYFLSVSNFDITRPKLQANNQDYLKIVLEKIGETGGSTIINKYSILPNSARQISYTMIDKNRLLLVYSAKNSESEQDHIFIDIVQVKKTPDMIAVSNGRAGETVKVAEW